MKKEMHAACLFPIRGTIPCTFLLKIFHIVNSANTFVTEKQNLSIFVYPGCWHFSPTSLPCGPYHRM